MLKNTLLDKTFYRFILVGIINTIVGFGIIWLLFHGFSVDYRWSYFIGTCIGVLVSYVLNRCYTFRSKIPWATGLIKFLLSGGISYLVSNACLIISVEKLKLPHALSFIFAMISYTVVNYLLSRIVVFRKPHQ